MEKILTINNLVKKYGKNIAVNDVSFSLEKGKVYGLLGPNGAGKTTIMKILVNQKKKDSGTIEYDDDLVIKYLMDVPKFYEYMKVEEFLDLLATFNNLKESVDPLLKKTGLFDHKNKKIKALSRGLRQKLGIASMLIGKVDLLILDEPISALDPVGRQEVMDIIKSLKGETTVVFSSHILSDIEEVCDDILLINGGKILLDDSCENILKKKNILLVKLSNIDEALVLKEMVKDCDFSQNIANTLEIKYEDLITTQQEILKCAKKKSLTVEKMEIKSETLQDIFLSEVKKSERV